jgi:hypothetical protein
MNSAKRPKYLTSKKNVSAEKGHVQVCKNNIEVMVYNIDCEYCPEDDDFLGSWL